MSNLASALEKRDPYKEVLDNCRDLVTFGELVAKHLIPDFSPQRAFSVRKTTERGTLTVVEKLPRRVERSELVVVYTVSWTPHEVRPFNERVNDVIVTIAGSNGLHPRITLLQYMRRPDKIAWNESQLPLLRALFEQ